MVPPCRTTAPTRGFGATRPQPRSARSRARPIASRSGAPLEAEAEPDACGDMGRLGIEIPEGGSEALILPGLESELGHEFQRGEVEPAVHEQDLTCVVRIDDDRPHARGGRSIVKGDACLTRRIVVETEPPRDIDQYKIPDCAGPGVVRPTLPAERKLVTAAKG